MRISADEGTPDCPLRNFRTAPPEFEHRIPSLANRFVRTQWAINPSGSLWNLGPRIKVEQQRFSS